DRWTLPHRAAGEPARRCDLGGLRVLARDAGVSLRRCLRGAVEREGGDGRARDRLDPRGYLLLGLVDGGGAGRGAAHRAPLQPRPRPVHRGLHRRRDQPVILLLPAAADRDPQNRAPYTGPRSRWPMLRVIRGGPLSAAGVGADVPRHFRPGVHRWWGLSTFLVVLIFMGPVRAGHAVD